ncbi:AraC family transcriptional regulator [Ulvibacterium sp.]|uniref:AraC family transcriptional regulator n=1 Tax=Ulvibacterium sp. TaxID=2665914 RepID=UPI002611E29E|nr:AraC family transcriptional regulator [Ulvibacterium sp.]
MKADFQKLSTESNESSFRDFWVKADYFGFHWHYHPEIEICFVKNGRGKRVIGENVSDFGNGDLVLVGSNTPHSWITDEFFNNSKEQMEVYVVQFSGEILKPFLGIMEFQLMDTLLTKAVRGIQFTDIRENGLGKSLLEIGKYEGATKFLKLLELLDRMCRCKKASILCSTSYKADYKRYHEERILKVCNHIHEHYKNVLTIESLAEIVAMNPSSFCRFFKRVLGKTVIEYINELRIAHVCNQIQNSDLPIYQMAFDAGFSSIAHFNKQFKRNTGKTPVAYRKWFGGVNRAR